MLHYINESMEINYDKLIMNDTGCMEEIKETLDVKCNYKAGKLIGRVLHTIRDSLNYNQSAELIQRLPDNIKVIYVSDWKLHHRKVELNHLDGLITEVLGNDSQHKDSVLPNEISALNTILITLKVLNKHIDILDFFNYSLKQELAEALSEAA